MGNISLFGKQFSLDSLLGIGSTTADLLGSSYGLSQISDTTDDYYQLNSLANTKFTGNSVDSLMGQWGNTRLSNNQYNLNDIRGYDNTELAGNILSSAGKGALTGLQFGPWGALIGGAAGALTSGIGSIIGTNKANQAILDLKAAEQQANNRVVNNYNSEAIQLNNNNSLLRKSTLLGNGGKIYIKPSKRGTFTAAAKKRGLGVQEFASKVLANKDKYSPAMVKKANFARNFGGRKANGGDLNDDIRSIDFYTYNPLFDRYLIPENMMQIQDSLINRGYREPQRNALLSTNFHESGGDPNAVDSTGNYRGIIQWDRERYPNELPFNKQITKMLDELETPKSPYWSDGGSGVPYTPTLMDAYTNFWNADNSYDAALYLNKGYIRPKDEQARINRALEAQNMDKYLKSKSKDIDFIEALLDHTYKNWDMKGDNNEYSSGGSINTHGGIFTNGVTDINEGGTHESNPIGGIPMGISADGQPNLVEEGEVIFKDYVFSNRLSPKNKDLKRVNLPISKKEKSYADKAKELSKESEERPNDPISKRGLEDALTKLTLLQEMDRQKENKIGVNKLKKYGGRKYSGEDDVLPEITVSANKKALPQFGLFRPYDANTGLVGFDDYPNIKREEYIKSLSSNDDANNISFDSTDLRYAPIVGSAFGTLKSAFTKPDYEHPNSLLRAAYALPSTNIKFTPVSGRVRYNPIDRNLLLNTYKNQAATNRRALMNAGVNPGNIMAGLAALGYNEGNSIGNAYLQIDEANNNRRNAAIESNRALDQYNSEGALKADIYNAQLAEKRNASKLAYIDRALQLKEASDNALEQARSYNYTNLFNNLGNLGREEVYWNMIENDPSRYGYKDKSGNIQYKGKYGGMLTKRTNKRRK